MARPRLDDFTQAFIEAALWSTNDESDESGGEPLDKNYSVSDIDEATLNAMIAQCADFQERFGELIDDDDSPDIRKFGNRELAGHDFWMTRGGHGVGFWEDSDWPKHGKELDEGAKEYGEMWLTVGDDGQIYGSPLERAPRAREHRIAAHERRSVAVMRDTPNLYWNRIPSGSRVELVGKHGSRSYVAILPDGSRANIYWSGQDAQRAQQTLDRMIQRGARSNRRGSGPLPGGTKGWNPLNESSETLPVIFRAERSGEHKGEVTAVFPTLPGTNASDFTVYAHVGQHSTGTSGWYTETRAATPAEYASLLSELRRIYEQGRDPVKLKVVERFTRHYDDERRKNARR